MKKPHIVELTEAYRRQVVVWAEDENEAFEIATDLYETGEIDMTRNTFDGLDIDVIGIAAGSNVGMYDQFS